LAGALPTTFTFGFFRGAAFLTTLRGVGLLGLRCGVVRVGVARFGARAGAGAATGAAGGVGATTGAGSGATISGIGAGAGGGKYETGFGAGGGTRLASPADADSNSASIPSEGGFGLVIGLSMIGSSSGKRLSCLMWGRGETTGSESFAKRSDKMLLFNLAGDDQDEDRPPLNPPSRPLTMP
jgi:hypothetical protein